MYKVLDLFSGAGGLTRGFVETGRFVSLAAAEIDPDARRSYALNFHDGSEGPIFPDVSHVTASSLPTRPDVIVGGPPCQDFTQLTAVRRDDKRERNDLLWDTYKALILELRPKVFVLENVPNLLTDERYAHKRQTLRAALESAGYRIEWAVLNAANFGVPQARRRSIIIGTNLSDRVPYLPLPDLPVKSAWTAIQHLSVCEPTPMPAKRPKTGFRVSELHFRRNTEILSRLRALYVLPDGNRMHIPRPITIKSWANKTQGTSDGYGRVFATRATSTIRCEGFKPEKGRFLHPFLNRPLTLAEMALIQSFPGHHVFYGSYTSIARQIGNAVPPLMAQHVAQVVLHLLEGQPLDIETRPDLSLGQTQSVKVKGSSTQERVLSLLRAHVGKPVPWWQIEQAAAGKAARHPDWGAALQELSDRGYRISVGRTDSDQLRLGEYRLESKEPLTLEETPTVGRLFDLVRTQRGPFCERCLSQENQAAPALIRVPDTWGLLSPDNVEVLCPSCLAQVRKQDNPIALREERVYAWIAQWRGYPPVRAALCSVLDVPEHEIQAQPPTNEDPDLLHHIGSKARGCQFCGTTRELQAALIRPQEAGGLVRPENIWAICEECSSDLAKERIKVNSNDAKTAVVYLQTRFGEPDFLTPQEAYYRNWLLQHRRDPHVLLRAKSALITGAWK